MNELDAYRCARLLVDSRGPREAWRHAVERALEMKEEGDKAGHLAWVGIIAAVEALTRTERQDGEALH